MPGGANRDIVLFACLYRDSTRRTVFHKNGDSAAFVTLLQQAGERTPVHLLAHHFLSGHFHLALWPRLDRDLSDYVMWLLTAHVRRYHQRYHGTGHVWQGRFRAFPIQEDDHLLTVLRYMERNPVRASLVERAQNCPLVQCRTRAGLRAAPRSRPGPATRRLARARQRGAAGGSRSQVPA